MTPTEASLTLGWIPLFPLLGAVFNLLFGRWVMRSLGDRLGREVVHLVAIGAVAFSCFYCFSIVMEAMTGPEAVDRVVHRIYPWIVSGETVVGFDLMIDRLSAVMCLVVTGVGLLIHIFSVGYMAKDPAYWRYFAYLNLFMASMLVLVMGKSLVVTFVGWEGVGLCSYLLIGFWYDDAAKATAGKKAFIVNRIGDFGVLLGMLVIYSVTQSLDYDAINAVAASGEESPFLEPLVVLGENDEGVFTFALPVASIATLLIFLGCTGKSAQIPLYTWLPDAMAGPTPVSALIHAATMVTAGVYLVVRLNPLFALAPLTMAIIAAIGAATALLAATIGITQNDIKKVLAYSTVSQLGFMFLAAGMGAWVAAIFHLVTHAFFKACLFLGSGAVIEACHHNQDIRTMGGLKEKMPWTARTFFVSCLAIAGIPPLAGFFSKDEILLSAYVNASEWTPGINYAVWTVGILTAFFTAFYMFRLYYLVFEGKFRGDHHTWTHHVAEHWIMTFPLIVLAVGAAFGGLLGVPHVFPIGMPHVLGEWLAPVIAVSDGFGGLFYVGARPEFVDDHGHVRMGVELGLMAASVAVGLAGWGFARSLYKDGPSKAADEWRQRFSGLYAASYAKYWVDELYDTVIVRPVRVLGGVFYQVGDQLLIDGLGIAGVTVGTVNVLGNRMRVWHNGNVRRYLVVLLLGAGIVLATVYANPTIAQFGPSKVHPVDLGGLRPTLGEQPVKVTGPGFEFRLGPEPRRRQMPGDAAPAADPQAEPAPAAPAAPMPRPRPASPPGPRAPAPEGERKAPGGAP